MGPKRCHTGTPGLNKAVCMQGSLTGFRSGRNFIMVMASEATFAMWRRHSTTIFSACMLASLPLTMQQAAAPDPFLGFNTGSNQNVRSLTPTQLPQSAEQQRMTVPAMHDCLGHGIHGKYSLIACDIICSHGRALRGTPASRYQRVLGL